MKNILKWFKVKMNETTTTDGTEIGTDSTDFTVGASVYVITPDGNLPAPDGDYQTTDNKSFTVVSGVITISSVASVAAAAADPAPSDPEDTVILDAIANLTSMIKDLIQTVSQMVDEEKKEDATEGDKTTQSKEEELSAELKLKAEEIERLKAEIEDGKTAASESIKKKTVESDSDNKITDFERRFNAIKNLKK